MLFKMTLTKGGYHFKKDRQYNDQKTKGQIYKSLYRKLKTGKHVYERKPKRHPLHFQDSVDS